MNGAAVCSLIAVLCELWLVSFRHCSSSTHRHSLHSMKCYSIRLSVCHSHRRQRRRGCMGCDAPIFDLQGSSCVDDPRIFWQMFYFFPFSGTSEYCKSLSFSWHMNLQNNTPRMHHITPFWDKKFINFLGRGTAPPFINFLWRGTAPSQTSHPSLPMAPRFSRLRRSTCDSPMFQWR